MCPGVEVRSGPGPGPPPGQLSRFKLLKKSKALLL